MVSSILYIVKNELRRLRQEAGLSQASLGEMLDVSRQTVIAIETGRYDPSLKLAMRIARQFGVRVEEMFDDSEHDD
jgi:putative transcriptional regulator